MRTNRLEAFSDGVVAILITIMVLELKIPHQASLRAVRPVLPVLLTYVLSFATLGIYWNNHHHLLQVTARVNGAVLWANLLLLFFLSLFPFATGWMGENHFATIPVAFYGIVLLAAALAYYVLQTTIVRAEGESSRVASAIGSDLKGKLSPVIFAAAIPVALGDRWVALGMYVFVVLMWLVPDRRLEARLAAAEEVASPPPGDRTP